MIDFILHLLSFEHPGLSYGVIDPLTMSIILKAGAGVTQGVSNIITGRKDEKEAEERLKELGAEEEALKKKRTYGVADTFNKYLAASKQDKASDLLRQQEKERFATNVGALSGGGAKALLGGLAAQSRQSAMQQAQIEAGAQERQLDAMKQYAAVEQSAANQNVGLAAEDLARTQGMIDETEAARQAARQKKRDGITGTITPALNAAGDFYENEAASLTTSKYGAKVYQHGGPHSPKLDDPDMISDAMIESGNSAASRISAARTAAAEADEAKEKKDRLTASEKKALRRDKKFRDKEKRYTAKRDRLKRDRGLAPNVFERRQRLLDAINTRQQMQQTARQLDMLNQSNLTAQERQAIIDKALEGGSTDDSNAEVPIIAPDRASNAGTTVGGAGETRQGLTLITPEMRAKFPGIFGKHGAVQKTPGEFSHSKNPIDIMKDGAKIGEMTGGEYIFNPRQASTLQSLASKGGSPLHKYVRNLLKEFDKR